MGVVAILVMWPRPFEQILFPHLRESPYEIWVQMAHCMFENVDGRADEGVICKLIAHLGAIG